MVVHSKVQSISLPAQQSCPASTPATLYESLPAASPTEFFPTDATTDASLAFMVVNGKTWPRAVSGVLLSLVEEAAAVLGGRGSSSTWWQLPGRCLLLYSADRAAVLLPGRLLH
jgi:hypothetical protein